MLFLVVYFTCPVLPFCWPQDDLKHMMLEELGWWFRCLPAAPFAMFHLFSEAPCRSIEACAHEPSLGAKTGSVKSKEAHRMRRALA